MFKILKGVGRNIIKSQAILEHVSLSMKDIQDTICL